MALHSSAESDVGTIAGVLRFPRTPMEELLMKKTVLICIAAVAAVSGAHAATTASGFLDIGEKDVIVPFTAVKSEKKNDKWWLTLDETKDSLKGAPGFEYNKNSTAWELKKR
jgi:hypothetical protein